MLGPAAVLLAEWLVYMLSPADATTTTTTTTVRVNFAADTDLPCVPSGGVFKDVWCGGGAGGGL